jgi:hypothetical protein
MFQPALAIIRRFPSTTGKYFTCIYTYVSVYKLLLLKIKIRLRYCVVTSSLLLKLIY